MGNLPVKSPWLCIFCQSMNNGTKNVLWKLMQKT